jgi:hypothetical protein
MNDNEKKIEMKGKKRKASPDLAQFDTRELKQLIRSATAEVDLRDKYSVLTGMHDEYYSFVIYAKILKDGDPQKNDQTRLLAALCAFAGRLTGFGFGYVRYQADCDWSYLQRLKSGKKWHCDEESMRFNSLHLCMDDIKDVDKAIEALAKRAGEEHNLREFALPSFVQMCALLGWS